ncbi:MAG: hypothetical protein VKJ46_10105 [Leptolyngbyaceae bacterium]|nr:hypothetical protein [Leptolyngbyaceae bacterium]
MNYPIPASLKEIDDLRYQAVDEEIVATAIAGVVGLARSYGQSLDDLQAEVLHDDSLLDLRQRRWLSDIVAQAWKTLP